MSRLCLLAGFCLLFCSSQATADTIVAYGLFDTPGNQATQPPTEDLSPFATGQDMVRGGGLNPVDPPFNANNSFHSNGWATNAENTPTVVNTGGYVEIGFTPAPGFGVTLDQLIMGSRSSGSGPAMIGVFTSLDSYTTPIFTIDQSSTPPNTPFFVNSTIDLSSLGDVTDAFSIRFMNVSGDQTADPNRAGEMDEFSAWRISDHFDAGNFSDTRITGTLFAIPEPVGSGTVLLLAVGVFLKRRRS
ncbi:MAG: hypothetical protein ACR2NP_06685 [Pirellulaceae bacterium]